MRKFLIIVILIILVVGLSCSDQEDKLTFMHFWTSSDVRPVIVELIDEFETANPGIEVELIDLNWSNGHDKITVAFATETAADVIELGSDWVPEYAARDLLMDLSDQAGPYRDSLMGWQAAELGNNVYGFPWMLGTRVLFYNKNLLKEAGLDPQKPPRTWDELYTFSETINQLGEPFYGFGSNSYEKFRLYKKFLPFLWSNDGSVISDDDSCLFDSRQAVEALDFYTRLTDIGYLESQRNLDDKFLAGELGFIISGDWILRRIRVQPPDFPVGAALIPGPDGGRRSASFLGGEFLTVNSKSKHKTEALKLIRFLVSRDADLRFNRAAGSVTPSNKQSAGEIIRDVHPLAMVFLDQLNYAVPSPVHPQWVLIQDIVEDAVQKAIYHKAEIEDILRSACGEITRILNE
jgi:multiple sugar transport system substrate-binding protein